MAATTAPLVWDFYRAVDGAAGLGTVAEYDDESSQSIYLASGMQTRVAQISEGHWSDAEPGDEIEITPDDFDATAWDHPMVGQLYGAGVLGDELWFFRYLYAEELTQLRPSGSVKLRRDSQIAQLDLRVANAGEGLFDASASLFSPGAKLTAAVTMGDSAQYPLIEAYLDEFDYDRHAADVSLSGRNNIARLSDQTFDDDTTFTGNGHEVVEWIFGLAGITKFRIGPSDYSQDWTFDPDKKLLDGLKDVFEFFAGWALIELPDGTLCVGYPAFLAQYQVNSVYQFDGNVDVTKRKTKKSMDAAYSSVRVTGKAADGTDLTPVLLTVNNFGHWNLGSHRTKHVQAADGLTQAELAAYAAQLAAELQYIGVGETFDGPLRPYLLPGDVASVTYDGGVSADLGLITSITHSFGVSGFFTSFAVDSGGVATAQTRSGEAYTTRSASVNGYNRQQDLADLIGTIRGKNGKDGAKGEQGDPGDPGTPGAAAEITGVSASASQLPAGSSPTASATAGGTAQARTFAFAFGIPKGDKGDTGATGATGATGPQGPAGPNSIGSSTASTLNGVLAGNGSTVEVKPVDSTPTANSTNLVTSGGVKSAISYTSLGSFATLAELSAALDTALAAMDVTSPKYIVVNATATVNPFVNTYYYKGILTATTVNFASCVLEPMGTGASAVLCRRALGAGWTYQAIATSADVDAVRGLAQKTEIASGTDLNTLTDVGVYSCASTAIAGTLANCPASSAFSMFVTALGDEGTKLQEITSASGIWRRIHYVTGGGGWTDWTGGTMDSTPTESSTNYVTSGGVYAATIGYDALGTFTTLAALGTLLDTKLASMSANSQNPIRISAGATVYPFTNSYGYYGTLSKSGVSDYASAILSPGGQDNVILCRRSQAEGWTFTILTHSVASFTVLKSSSLNLHFANGAVAIILSGGLSNHAGLYETLYVGGGTCYLTQVMAAPNLAVSSSAANTVTIENTHSSYAGFVIVLMLKGEPPTVVT